MLVGDFGISAHYQAPVTLLIRQSIGPTVQLALTAMLIALLIAVPIGIISAARPGSWLDIIGTTFALSGVAIPNFLLGILLILLFALTLRVLPSGGYVPPTQNPGESFRLMLMPAFALGAGLSAVLMRQIRSAMLEVLNQDYVTTARAKGLAGRTVVLRHALKNALIPVHHRHRRADRTPDGRDGGHRDDLRRPRYGQAGRWLDLLPRLPGGPGDRADHGRGDPVLEPGHRPALRRASTHASGTANMVQVRSAPGPATSAERAAPPPLVAPGPAASARRVGLAGYRASLQRLLKVRGAAVGLCVLVVLVFLAVAAPVVSPYDPLRQDLLETLKPPSSAHLFGTDDLGRDVLARVIYGSRVSLEVGLISIAVALVGGILVGLVAGYVGGAVDDVLMRIMDAISAFPSLILALAITAALGAGIGNAMIAIGIVYTPLFARLIRSQALTIRELDYCLAARTLGAGAICG